MPPAAADARFRTAPTRASGAPPARRGRLGGPASSRLTAVSLGAGPGGAESVRKWHRRASRWGTTHLRPKSPPARTQAREPRDPRMLQKAGFVLNTHSESANILRILGVTCPSHVHMLPNIDPHSRPRRGRAEAAAPSAGGATRGAAAAARASPRRWRCRAMDVSFPRSFH